MTENESTETTTLRVADLMTRNAIYVLNTDSLTSAIATMNQHDISMVPVLDAQQRVCGVLSVDDLLPVAYSMQCDLAVLQAVSDVVRKTLTDALAEDSDDRKVRDYMTRSVETAGPADLIKKAARKFVENDIHHLPVVDVENRIVGILSTMDVVRSVAFH